MKIKQKLKKFFTLQHRANEGFTLIELIVVIAIMAILAGVGSVGYAGYVKSANKKADMAMVGDVMRAIETGIYSYTFELPEVLEVGKENGVTFPVGFVVLTENGTSAVSTGSTYSTGEQDKECEKATITFYPVQSKTVVYAKYGIGSALRDSEVVYTLGTPEEHEYCATHTKIPAQRKVTTSAKAGSFSVSVQSSVTGYIGEDFAGLYSLVTGHTYGEKRETTQITAGGDGAVVENQVLQEALEMAYGTQPSKLKLSYDGWTAQTTASFYSDATYIFGAMSEKLKTVTNLSGGLQEIALSQSYKSTDDLTISVAERVSSISEEAFLTAWELVDNSTEEQRLFDQSDFGVGGGTNNGREYYSAVRAMYNAAFATYLKNNGHSDHADEVESFSTPVEVAGFDIDLGLPASICRSAFTNPESNLDPDVKSCKTCQKLYDQYVDSGASRENAKAIYATTNAISDTASEIDKTGDYNAKDFFDYYNQYLNEFASLYGTVNEMTKGESAIVVAVYYTDGELTYEVSPLEANPRNK